ncbi:MAG: MFS transporter [Thermoplasmata archaeon]
MKPEAIQLLSSAGLFGPAIIVPVILKHDFNASESTIGLIAGLFAGAGFASSYAFGRAADVYGKRMILLAGLFLSGFATLVQVASLVVGGLVFFASVRIIIGLCSGIFPAALITYAYDAKVKMGWLSSFGAAGWGFGNLAVGMFGAFYEGAYVFCAAIIFVSFAIALMLPFPREVTMRVPLFPTALIKRNAAVYSAMLIRHTGANMIWVTYPLFLLSIGADEMWIGIIYSVNAFGQFFVMNVVDRFDPALLVAVGLASSALTFFTFTLVRSYWEIMPSQALLATAWGCLYVGSLRYVMDRNKEKATATGILSSTMSISGIVGPVLGGVAAMSLGFKGTIGVASAMAVVALLIFLYELRRAGEFNRLRWHFRVRT